MPSPRYMLALTLIGAKWVAQFIAATRGRKVDCLARQVTRPVVPSAVSYEDVREGNDPYRALGHGTHSLLTGT